MWCENQTREIQNWFWSHVKRSMGRKKRKLPFSPAPAHSARVVTVAGRAFTVLENPSLGPGGSLWDGGVALARHLAALASLQGKSLLELGAGVGLPGIVAAATGASPVYITDRAHVVPLTAANVEANVLSRAGGVCGAEVAGGAGGAGGANDTPGSKCSAGGAGGGVRVRETVLRPFVGDGEGSAGNQAAVCESAFTVAGNPPCAESLPTAHGAPPPCNVSCPVLEWGCNMKKAGLAAIAPDFVVGADVAAGDESVFPLLLKTIKDVCEVGTTTLILAYKRRAAYEDRFFTALRAAGFVTVDTTSYVVADNESSERLLQGEAISVMTLVRRARSDAGEEAHRTTADALVVTGSIGGHSTIATTDILPASSASSVSSSASACSDSTAHPAVLPDISTVLVLPDS